MWHSGQSDMGKDLRSCAPVRCSACGIAGCQPIYTWLTNRPIPVARRADQQAVPETLASG